VSHNILPISYEFLRVWREGGEKRVLTLFNPGFDAKPSLAPLFIIMGLARLLCFPIRHISTVILAILQILNSIHFRIQIFNIAKHAAYLSNYSNISTKV